MWVSFIFLSSHIFSYQECLIGFRLCPICRTEGLFRPLLCEARSELISRKPDHVIIPCGHLIGKREGVLWSSVIRVPVSKVVEIALPKALAKDNGFNGSNDALETLVYGSKSFGPPSVLSFIQKYKWIHACPFCGVEIRQIQPLYFN